MAELRVLETRDDLLRRNVIETLEACLALARRGELSGVAIAAVRTDGGGFKSWSDGASSNGLVGVVALLQHRLMERITEGGTETDDA